MNIVRSRCLLAYELNLEIHKKSYIIYKDQINLFFRDGVFKMESPIRRMVSNIQLRRQIYVKTQLHICGNIGVLAYSAELNKLLIFRGRLNIGK